MGQRHYLFSFFTTVVLLFLVSCTGQNGPKEKTQTYMDFNFDWEFKLIDSTNSYGWQKVNLPHDWSVEFPFDERLEGCTGYLRGGQGRYRKEFSLNLSENKTAYILFDGIYNNATVWLNNSRLGHHPYGYSPFFYDISKWLKKDDADNIVEVAVDRTRYADSRWYSGSGIYRNVELVVKNKLHIPIWGSFVTTPQVKNSSATVRHEITVKNDFPKAKNFELQIQVYDSDDVQVAEHISKGHLEPAQRDILVSELSVANPKLWDIENPYRYTSYANIIVDGKIVDVHKTTFGIRTIDFDAERGFFLNGDNLKIKGVCLHHDAGLVGAAVPKGVWKRRLSKLKKSGCNAIRVSHNPASQEFLDLCDEMGFLVQDEFFDEWDNPKDKRLNMNEKSKDHLTRGYTEHFQEWAEKDVKNTLLAHRNHPCIIQWSIGNEIEWTYPRNGDATGFFNNMHWSGNYFWSVPPNTPEEIAESLERLPKGKYDIGKTATKLAEWTRELDTTRYITANCILPSSSYESGYVDALDMVGYSYRRVLYDYGHENYPKVPLMGTENLVQWHEWKAVVERPFVAGTYLWTGIDYMGESNGSWPKKGTNSGMLDLAGFEKPSYHMMKTLWNEEPHIYITTQLLGKSIYKLDAQGEPVEKEEGRWKRALWFWHDVNTHWNYKEQDSTVVEVYSNCDAVELFLNETSLGTKKLTDFDDRIYKWHVPFTKGVLKAIGKCNDTVKSYEWQIETVGKPVGVGIESDKSELTADGYDVAHIVVELLDANGKPVLSEDKEVSFTVSGDVTLLGVDNGAVTNVQPFKSDTIKTHRGKCLLIVQSTKKSSDIEIIASGKDLRSAKISLKSR